jgi:hypothetical protein
MKWGEEARRSIVQTVAIARCTTDSAAASTIAQASCTKVQALSRPGPVPPRGKRVVGI